MRVNGYIFADIFICKVYVDVQYVAILVCINICTMLSRVLVPSTYICMYHACGGGGGKAYINAS